jgi:hypothetical protein
MDGIIILFFVSLQTFKKLQTLLICQFKVKYVLFFSLQKLLQKQHFCHVILILKKHHICVGTSLLGNYKRHFLQCFQIFEKYAKLSETVNCRINNVLVILNLTIILQLLTKT